MNRRRPEAGDHENTSFEPVDPDSHHVKPGFDEGEAETEKEREGEVRFPHRRAEKDVPKAPLSERFRKPRGA